MIKQQYQNIAVCLFQLIHSILSSGYSAQTRKTGSQQDVFGGGEIIIAIFVNKMPPFLIYLKIFVICDFSLALVLSLCPLTLHNHSHFCGDDHHQNNCHNQDDITKGGNVHACLLGVGERGKRASPGCCHSPSDCNRKYNQTKQAHVIAITSFVFAITIDHCF